MNQPRPIFKELPRRPPLAVRRGQKPPPRRREVEIPRASMSRILLRSARWGFALLKMMGRLMGDRGRGGVSSTLLGVRLREVFEEMGGTAIKLGQQMSVRIDLLPFEVCDELAKLSDKVPPFPTEHAIERIESVTGMDLEDIFETFDPRPIGAASIACVWQAVLKENGQRVAVKVQRPDVGSTFASDLGVVDLVTRALETLSIVKPGFFRFLRAELRAMFLEELDFTTEARYQRLFRRFVRKDKLDKWVDAPEVYTRYSGVDVLITEFVSGVWCTEVLAAHENEDEEALRQLAEMGITPKKVGRRMMALSFWSRYEALFYHGDPHPGNIVIQPGARITLIDFGACGTLSRKSRLAQLMIMDRMARDDISGVVDAALTTLEPLPPLDVYELKKALETAFWSWLFAFKDKDAEWWERTTAGLWLALLEVTRERQIPVGLETLRLARSLLLYDTLCFRLDPEMVNTKEFKKWRRKAMKRGADRVRRRLDKEPLSLQADTLLFEGDELISRARFLAWQGERFLDSLPNEFATMLDKASHVIQVGINFALGVVVVLGGSLLAAVGYHRVTGKPITIDQLVDLAWDVHTHPVVLGTLALLCWLTFRRLLFRVRELDVKP